MVYVTRGLLTVLLEYAAKTDPESVTFALSVTEAGTLSGAEDLPADTPVFTHFYLADAGKSVSAIFGVDLGTPAGQTQGRFISHPDGFEARSKSDDFNTIMFIATPPWTEDAVRVFDRTGKEQPLTIVDAEPPEEDLP